ncbi:hypothetical protein QTN25_000573 [Entamoeba marina]
MKINPWKNITDVQRSIYNIQKTFPRIETFRIDLDSLLAYGESSFLKKIKNFDLVKDSIIPQFTKLPQYLLGKCHLAFSLDDITTNTRIVILNTFTIQILKQIQQLRYIQKLYLKIDYIPYSEEIIELNECTKTMNVTICFPSNILKQLKNKKHICSKINIVSLILSSYYVIPRHDDINFYDDLINETDTMILFEKYFLPTTICINSHVNNFVDLTPFQYVQNVKLNPIFEVRKIYIKLPISTQTITLEQNKYNLGEIEVVNWNELNNLQEIQDHHQLSIPYPQIKKKKFIKQFVSSLDAILAMFNIICALFTITSFIFHIINIIYSDWDISYIQQASFYHFFVYLHFVILIFVIETFKNFYSGIIGTFVFCLSCVMLLWYPYSLLFYQSTYLIHLFTLLTIPTTFGHFIVASSHLRLTTADYNTFLNKLLHGYWFDLVTSTKLVNIFGTMIDNTSLLSMAIILFTLPVGLIVSFFNLNGMLSFFSLLGFIGSLAFLLKLIYLR